jgi:uncharacterized membrane protein YgcG
MLRASFNNIGRKVGLLCAFFMLILVQSGNASYLLVNDNIVNAKVSKKIESMGTELFEKTSVNVYAVALETLNKQTIIAYEQIISKELKSPYVLLTLAKDEEQVDIVYSKDLEDKIDKEAILSPFPWSGTIVPLLAVKKDHDKYNAAMLNGYADIVERIADSYHVKLESAIGSTNKNIIFYFKMALYAFLLSVLIRYIFKKVRK